MMTEAFSPVIATAPTPARKIVLKPSFNFILLPAFLHIDKNANAKNPKSKYI
jgi:hypothetical protein